MKSIIITEGQVKLKVPDPKEYKLDSKMPVFYNPAMVLNRDISVLLCKVLKPESALDLLAASGARGLRLKKEASIPNVFLNDGNPKAADLMKDNAKLNKLDVQIINLNANKLLSGKQSYAYIDVDPFGPPIKFTDKAVQALDKNGVIAVTATDTSALCGTYPRACKRKYNSVSVLCGEMNEIGIRILIKHVQEVAAKHKIALEPIFCHATRHYMRVYLKVSKKPVKEILKQHGMYKKAGKLWTGNLFDAELVDEMLKNYTPCYSKETFSLLNTIREESKVQTLGFYDIHEIAKENKTQVPKLKYIQDKLREQGFESARTHFSNMGIKTSANEKMIVKILKQ